MQGNCIVNESEISLSKISEMKFVDVDVDNLIVIFLNIFHNIFYVMKYKNSHKPYKLV